MRRPEQVTLHIHADWTKHGVKGFIVSFVGNERCIFIAHDSKQIYEINISELVVR